jgi:hypothetical protein
MLVCAFLAVKGLTIMEVEDFDSSSQSCIVSRILASICLMDACSHSSLILSKMSNPQLHVNFAANSD